MHATPRQRQPMPMKRVFPSNNDDENIIDNPSHIPQSPASATPTAARVKSVFTTPLQAPSLSSPASPASEQLRQEEEQEYKRLRVEVETQRKKAGKIEASGGSGGNLPAETEKNTVEEKPQGVESFGGAQRNSAGEQCLEQSIQARLAEFRKQLETMTEYFESLKSSRVVNVEDNKRLEELKSHVQTAFNLLSTSSKPRSRPPPRTPLLSRSIITTLPPSTLGKHQHSSSSPPPEISKRSRSKPTPLTTTSTPTKHTIPSDSSPREKRPRTHIAPTFDPPLSPPHKRPNPQDLSRNVNSNLPPLLTNRPIKRPRTRLGPSINLGKRHPADSRTDVPGTPGKRVKRTYSGVGKPQVVGVKRGRSENDDSGREKRKEGREKGKRVRAGYTQDGDPEVEYYDPGELLSSDDESEDEEEGQEEEWMMEIPGEDEDEAWLNGDEGESDGTGKEGGAETDAAHPVDDTGLKSEPQGQ